MRLSGNKGQYFFHEGRKLIAFHMSLQCLSMLIQGKIKCDKTPGGGTCQNFDRDARPIFLGLKFGQILFFWVGRYFSYFSGFAKFPLFFWV